MKNYIITGHKGMIGEHLKKELDKTYECKLTIDKRENGDLTFGDFVPDMKADMFVHLAAHCKINDGTLDPRLPFINNVQGTFNCLEYCRHNDIKKFIYASSSRVLSKEENPYTASKKFGENLCEAYRRCYGIEFLVIRPSTVYGEHDDKTGRLITNWAKQALNGEPLEIFGNKDKTLDFTHVSDFVDGAKLLIDNWESTKNKAYDISGEDERTLVDVYDLIIKETNSKSKLIFKEPEIAQPQSIKIDISNMKKLGYNPKVKLEEGIKQLVEYYKNE